jgi:hypothetical protein
VTFAALRRSLALGLLLALAGVPRAEAAEGDCPTLLPDLHCARTARPEGSGLPMSMPYLFEDPYITSGLQFVGVWHDLPEDSLFRGGDVGVLALQARLAITDWLAFIATKDGYTILRPNVRVGDVAPGAPNARQRLIKEDEGFMDITAGFKAKVLDWNDLVVTPALRYEIPLGDAEVFQGNGDGVLIPSASAGWHRDGWHLLASLGGQVPIDEDQNSTSIFYNLHVDHAFAVKCGVLRYLTPFVELSGIHWVESGNGQKGVDTALGRLPLSTAQAALGTGAFEGADVANLGSSGISGANLVTMAWGVRAPLEGGLNVGLAYERPLSNRRDIFEQRLTLMASWEF